MVLEYRLCETFIANFALSLDFIIFVWNNQGNLILQIFLIILIWLLFTIFKSFLFHFF